MLPSTLDFLEREVREILSHYSQDSITSQQIYFYINKSYVSIPDEAMVHELETVFRLSTQPNVGFYDLQKMKLFENQGDQWNIIDKYYRFGPRVTVNGCPINFYTDREKFLCHTCTTDKVMRAKGKKVNDRFTFTIGKNVLSGSITIYLKEGNQCESITIQDKIVDRCTGNFTYENSCKSYPGTINYLTGEVDIGGNDFKEATILYTNYEKGKPCSLLFWGTVFYLYPVPDCYYQIKLEATMRPTALLQGDHSIFIREWDDFIIYETARRIFNFKRDKEGIAFCEYELKKIKNRYLKKYARHLQEGSTGMTRQCYKPSCCGGGGCGGGCCGN